MTILTARRHPDKSFPDFVNELKTNISTYRTSFVKFLISWNYTLNAQAHDDETKEKGGNSN